MSGWSHGHDSLATAIQRPGRATLVGMLTAGNSEWIAGFNIADHSLIRLAASMLLLSDGNTLEFVGVISDVEVPLGDWGLREDPDVHRQAARNFSFAECS